MAVFNDATFRYILENEGGYSNDPNDAGGKTMWGVTESVARANGYVGDMRDMPMQFAYDVFKSKYWSYDWIDDQRLADKVCDCAVNMGPKVAMLLLQMCVFSDPDQWDGIAGPKTRAAVNGADASCLIKSYADKMACRYEDIAVKPSNKKFLKGWLKRAERMP